MKEKRIAHNKKETCNFSKEEINTEKDEYSIVIDCKGDEIESVKFYKTKYLSEIIKGNIQKLSNHMLQGAQNVAENMMEKIMLGFFPKQYEVKDSDMRP